MKMAQTIYKPLNLLLLVFFALNAPGCIKIESANQPAKSPEAPPLETKPEPVVSIKEDAPPEHGYQVKFETTKGEFIVEVDEDLAPLGAKRFFNLVKSGFYDQCRFFRVMPGFMVQFGINGDPTVQSKWKTNIQDDPVKTTNKKGTITFATSGPDSRTTQVFINYADNAFLDSQGFSPFGKVIKGMEVVESIESKHRENPDQGAIQSGGNTYLIENFPDLDFIKKAYIYDDEARQKEAASPTANTPATPVETKPEMKADEQPGAAKSAAPASPAVEKSPVDQPKVEMKQEEIKSPQTENNSTSETPPASGDPATDKPE